MSDRPPHRPPIPPEAAAPADTRTPAADTLYPAAGPPPAGELRPGARPVPEYELVEKLGEGSFGQVWKARDDNGKEVALKFLPHDPHAAANELRELEVMKNLGHAHLLVLYRYWRLGNRLVVALELSQGTLLDRLREANRQGHAGVPFDELLEYTREAAKALDYLHGRGIQHRDVKPANLLLVGGTVKVADFGLAKLLAATVATNTNNNVAGTPAFAAPEVWESKTSAHSDQFALAVCWCQLRGGRLPFPGDSVMELAGAICLGTPDLSMIPEAERPAAARALAKDPKERFPTCKAFADALGSAPRPPQSGDLTPTWPTLHAPGPRPRARRLGVRSALLVLALLGVAAAASWLATRERELPRDAAGREDQPGKAKREDGGDKAREPPEGPGKNPPGRVAENTPGREFAKNQFTNEIGMTLVRVPAGRFFMGSSEEEIKKVKEAGGNVADEGPRREVEISKPFFLGTHEVTRGQFRRFVKEGNKTEAEKDGRGGWGYDAATGKLEGYEPKYNWENTGFPYEDDHPVVNVSWKDAAAFCNWLSKKEGRQTCYTQTGRDGQDWHCEFGANGYRLPTEAEWEYACRAGTTTLYPGGDDPEKLAEFGNVGDGTLKKTFPDRTTIRADDGYAFTAPVGRFKPNRFGLYDMHGNVWEWCWDWYSDKYYAAKDNVKDPDGPVEGTDCVLRGGSWLDPPWACRAAVRSRFVQAGRDHLVGFRVALSRPD